MAKLTYRIDGTKSAVFYWNGRPDQDVCHVIIVYRVNVLKWISALWRIVDQPGGFVS